MISSRSPFIVRLNVFVFLLSLVFCISSMDAQNSNRRNAAGGQQAQAPNTRLPGGAPDFFQNKSYQGSNGETIRYSLLEPLEVKAGEKFPLVLCLHGSQGATKAPDYLSTPEMRKKHPAFIMAPAAPRNKFWSTGGVPDNVNPEELRKRGMDKLESVEVELMEALEDVVANYPVDPDRIYITGQSKGGHGTWGTILKNPHRFAAAAPICGPVGTVDMKPLAHLPIWIFHGNADARVDVEVSRRVFKDLLEAGGQPGYTEFPGVGHSSWIPAYETPYLWDWMFEQSRTKQDK
ncbi:MAG: prolyl oligopeptidase family serine peptidase [Verrucomicrobiae bacterium]|nr:prolyl oligopeptidase family serine peptidase [Verrucomicrobiae bacterium]